MEQRGNTETSQRGPRPIPLKKKLKVRQLVNDIRAGLDDATLMHRYSLSSWGLHNVFRKLVRRNYIDQAEIESRNSHIADTVEVEDLRMVPRKFPALPVMVYDARNPERKGLVRDISEKGVGVSGIPCSVNEIKKLVISVGRFSYFEPVSFDARCCWVGEDRQRRKQNAGFEITDITKESLFELQELIAAFTLETDH